ncbi:hypothetical protein EDB89DRAFT_1396058 [Lactarius sanguifluus]|nr:hypothetical protein EDB89DRAFT_1396058 [Lactarius sanguifluus]
MAWLPIGFTTLPGGIGACCATTFSTHRLGPQPQVRPIPERKTLRRKDYLKGPSLDDWDLASAKSETSCSRSSLLTPVVSRRGPLWFRKGKA